LSESLSKVKPIPVLRIHELRIQQPLSGLAKRKVLRRLSEKRVTARVRKSLRRILDEKHLHVGCRALQENGIWIGHGSYKGEGFNWVVEDYLL